jgi:hypothetical protein
VLKDAFDRLDPVLIRGAERVIDLYQKRNPAGDQFILGRLMLRFCIITVFLASVVTTFYSHQPTPVRLVLVGHGFMESLVFLMLGNAMLSSARNDALAQEIHQRTRFRGPEEWYHQRLVWFCWAFVFVGFADSFRSLRMLAIVWTLCFVQARHPPPTRVIRALNFWESDSDSDRERSAGS